MCVLLSSLICAPRNPERNLGVAQRRDSFNPNETKLNFDSKKRQKVKFVKNRLNLMHGPVP